MSDTFDKFHGHDQKSIDYILNIGNKISSLKHDLIKETKELFPNDSIMLTQPTEGELLKMLVKLTNCKKGIEIGTFTGYSALCLAEGLPEDGSLMCFDISKDFTDLAKKYWKLNNLENKISLTLGNALQTLNPLITDSKNFESFDFAYVDADKPNYLNYYEVLLKLLKPNGWIVFDNVLWSLKVMDETCNDECTLAFRNLNKFLRNDERVEINMLDISDGITIVRKK